MKEKSPYLKKKVERFLERKKKSGEAHQRDNNRLRKNRLLLLQKKMFLLWAKYKLTYIESSRDTVIHKSLQEQDLNTPVKKVWTTSQDLHSILLTPTVSTLRPLLEQQTPGAVVYSDKTSLHCEPWQPQLSCVSPWIRHCTANSKSVWPCQWSPQIRQCNANSELASNYQK